MAKVFPGVPGIPTDEKPLWERLQEASKDVMRKALLFENDEGPVQRDALIKAVRVYKDLLWRSENQR